MYEVFSGEYVIELMLIISIGIHLQFTLMSVFSHKRNQRHRDWLMTMGIMAFLVTVLNMYSVWWGLSPIQLTFVVLGYSIFSISLLYACVVEGRAIVRGFTVGSVASVIGMSMVNVWLLIHMVK